VHVEVEGREKKATPMEFEEEKGKAVKKRRERKLLSKEKKLAICKRRNDANTPHWARAG